jgi:hypothetical protein
MSRSKHTRPRPILAAERGRAPYEPRGRADRSALRAQGRLMKRSGILLDTALMFDTSRSTRARSAAPLPQIVVKRPSKGCFHPALRRDIEHVLRFFGEEYAYGVRRIVLGRADVGCQASRSPGYSHRLVLGTLLVPGTVILYEQPVPPWVLSGRLRAEDAARLTRAGAVLEELGPGQQTVVHWPGCTLRDFMLFDGLMHEIGHHTLQHYKSKRSVRVARTADHEAFADRFAHECYRRYKRHKSEDGAW